MYFTKIKTNRLLRRMEDSGAQPVYLYNYESFPNNIKCSPGCTSTFTESLAGRLRKCNLWPKRRQ